MKVMTAYTAVALAVATAASAHAADAGNALVTIAYTDTVAPAEMHAYTAGIKAYIQCLHGHGVTFNEYALDHATGHDTYRITIYREPDVGPAGRSGWSIGALQGDLRRASRSAPRKRKQRGDGG